MLGVGPWVLFLLTVQGDLEHPIMVIPLPIATLVTLLWRKKNTLAGELVPVV